MIESKYRYLFLAVFVLVVVLGLASMLNLAIAVFEAMGRP